jgi:hypothetical protein
MNQDENIQNYKEEPKLVVGHKPYGKSWLKYVVTAFLLFILMFTLLLFFLPRHPLPFDTGAFVSISRTAMLPPKPNLAQRVEHMLLITEEHFFDHTPKAVSISAQPVTKWGVASLLNMCGNYSGTRYLISKDLAAGTVPFGNTNTMNGPQFISAIEDTISRSNVNWQDSSQVWRTEPLALLRFPEYKTIVVLPESEVADFLRTNGIDPHRFDDARK